MSQTPIERILSERNPDRGDDAAHEAEENRFFAIIRGDGVNEEFLELQLSNGNRVCFSYNDLSWFNFDPKAGCIDLDFGCAVVTVKGRGFVPKLWAGIKGKRVAWIKERDSEMQDHKDNETFIESIQIAPSDGQATETQGEES